MGERKMIENQEDKINEEFAEWFQGEYGLHRTRLQCFFEDCEVKDEKLRKDLILKWVGDAFRFGYKRANYDDAPWLNLSKEEVEELRKQKYELTEYAKEKLKTLLKEND